MWSDWESKQDYLNFSEVSQLAVDIINSPHMLPISIGIFGNWGAGKSSLLKLIEKDLDQSETEFLTVHFDAWLYQGFDDARAALLETIAREMAKEAKDNITLQEKIKNLIKRINFFRVMGLTAEGVALLAGVPTGGLLARSLDTVGNAVAKLKADEEFAKDDFENAQSLAREAKETATGILKPSIENTPPQQIEAFRREYSDVLKQLNKPLVVIIDNLDRCLPFKAIQTLEAIRLFLFLEHTAFVIAADEDMIRSAVGEYFKNTSARHQIDYLDKLIQIPIRVPKAGVREIRSYLFMLYAIEHGIEENELEQLRRGLELSLQASWQNEPITTQEALSLTGKPDDFELKRTFDLANRIAPILATSPIIHGNPRIVKRLLNVVKMRSQIAKRRNMSLDVGLITKLVIFERCAGADATSDLYRRIDSELGKPQILSDLEESDDKKLPSTAPKSWKANEEFILEWSKLEPKLGGKDLRAAVYLSRETMPLGVYVVGLSPKGRETLQTLAEVSSISSPAGSNVLKDLPLEEQVPVMEGLVDNLRQITDWSSQPRGFAGACLLARISSSGAEIFRSFILNIDQSAWMKSMLSNEDWFVE